MLIQEIKKILENARRRKEELDDNYLRLLELKCKAESITPTCSLVPIAGNNCDKMANYVARVDEISATIIKNIEVLSIAWQEAESLISLLENTHHRIAMRKHYMDNKTWKIVALEMNYSQEWVYNTRNKVLKEIFQKNTVKYSK